MNFHFTNKDLLKLYAEDAGPYRKSLPPQVVHQFFEVMDDVLSAGSYADLRSIKSFHYEKVPSECPDCRSLRINKQFRLIFREVRVEGEPGLEILDVKDYH